MKTDTTEKGLETPIMRHMAGPDGLVSGAAGFVAVIAFAIDELWGEIGIEVDVS